MDLSLTEEQDALVDTAREFTRKEIIPRAAHYDETGEFPREIFKKAFETGLMNVEIPEAYGGLGGSCLDNCLVQEEVSFGCSGINTSMAANSLGATPLLVAGTDEQKKKWLSRLTSELTFCAYCCSEPDAGSDVAGMRTRVTKHGDDYVLNGQKRWITNGGVASFYTVFATFDPAMKHKGIACFVVDANTPGLDASRHIHVMAPHPLATLRFTDCTVPASALLGEENEGFKLAMRTLDIFRASVAAAALGMARRALAEAVHHARQRRMFGQTLADFQLTQAKLGEMAALVDSAALLTYRAAWLRDTGQARVTAEAAMAKMTATENAQRVIDMALQLHGGRGVEVGSKVESLYRDIRSLRIYEGATEVQQLIIGKAVLQE